MDYESRIRELAHQFWEQEGRPHGRHEEHWHRACRDLRDIAPSQAGTRQPGAVQSSGDPTAVQTAGDYDVGEGIPDFMGVDDLGVPADRPTPADNTPAGTLPRRIL